jgi:hypothetical protein
MLVSIRRFFRRRSRPSITCIEFRNTLLRGEGPSSELPPSSYRETSFRSVEQLKGR